MYPSGATGLPTDCCFIELALKKINSACWSRTKHTSSSSHWKLTCSRHDIAEKLLNLLIVFLVDFRIVSTVWYLLFFYWILELFRQCGIFKKTIASHFIIIRECFDYEIGICCFSARRSALRKKSKDWLERNQNNVSEWSDMSTYGLLFQWDLGKRKFSARHKFKVTYHRIVDDNTAGVTNGAGTT
jgi:hypothetical protein